MVDTHANAPHEPVVLEEDHPNLPLIFGMMVGGIALLVVLVVGVHELFNATVHEELQHKVLDVPNSKLRALHAQEADRLGHYRWIDQKAGVVEIPIDRAMELTLRDWDKRPEGTLPPADAKPVEPAPAPPQPVK